MSVGQSPYTIPAGKNPSDVQASLDRVGNAGSPGSGVNATEPLAHITHSITIPQTNGDVVITFNGTRAVGVEAVPDEGYELDAFTGDLAEAETNPTELVVDGDVELGATFALIE